MKAGKLLSQFNSLEYWVLYGNRLFENKIELTAVISSVAEIAEGIEGKVKIEAEVFNR